MTAPIAIPDPLLDRMWKYYSDGKYAEARGAIADRLAREPGWQVPEDLLKRLEIGEARDRLVNASAAKQWNTVIQIAAATPSLLTCSDVDILWRLGEAFGNVQRTERARDVGLYILTNCQDPKERLATVQKAMPYLLDAELADLMALERTGADGRGEFAAVKADLARRRVGSAAKDKAATASPEDLAIIEQLARDGPKADDAVLLAGYLFQHEDIENAAKWYQLARTRADTPEIARGLAFALNALERPQEAEEAAYRWRDSTPENKQAYLVVATALLAVDPPIKLAATVVARMAKVISAEKYPLGARALGWYAYNTGQPLSAAYWFTAALTWKPDDEPSAFGLALSYQKLGSKAALQKLLKVWAPKSERIALLADPKGRGGKAAGDVLPMPPSIADPQGQQDALAQPGGVAVVTAVPVPGPDGTILAEPRSAPIDVRPQSQSVARVSAASGSGGGGAGGGGRNCAAYVAPERLGGASAVSRGWCLLDLNRPIEAADAFEAGMRSTTGKLRSDAAYGKTLADLRAGLTDSAAISASAAPQDTKRSVAMQAEILTQRALGAYSDTRYVETLFFLDERSRIAPEQNDLLMIRGWSYFHLHRLPEAKRIFVAVAGTGSREALRALAALASDRQGSNVGDARDRR
jgi:tetratricopeptide (TPR) repeat protein